MPALFISKDSIKDIDISKYKSITLLVGTNDLGPKWVWLKYKIFKRNPANADVDFVAPDYRKAPAEYIANEYKLLIEEIQRRNTSIKVIVSAILPRLFDFGSNKGYWSKVNSEIKDMWYILVCTYSCR